MPSVNYGIIKTLFVKILKSIIVKGDSTKYNVSEKLQNQFFSELYKEHAFKILFSSLNLFMEASELATYIRIQKKDLNSEAEKFVLNLKKMINEYKNKHYKLIIPCILSSKIDKIYSFGKIKLYKFNKTKIRTYDSSNVNESVLNDFQNKICFEIIVGYQIEDPFFTYLVYNRAMGHLKNLLTLFMIFGERTTYNIIPTQRYDYLIFSESNKIVFNNGINKPVFTSDLKIDELYTLKTNKIFKKLLSLIYKNPYELNEIETKIMNSFKWIYRSQETFEDLEKIMYLSIALETLLTKTDEREGIMKLIRKRISFILETDKYNSKINQIYDVRSSTVHGDEENIKWNKITDSKLILSFILFSTIKKLIEKKYKNLNEIIISILKQEIS